MTATTAAPTQPDMMSELYKTLLLKDRISTTDSVARYYWGLTPHRFQSEFWRICEKSGYNAILIPGPRDHTKTSSGLALMSKHILNNTNIRVLIAQKSREQARKSVRILKDFFETNHRILEDFGELKGYPWEADRFYLKRTNRQLKDPTVEGVGVMGTITGGHFDYIFVDDILDDANAKTELTRQRVADWFRGTVMGLAEPQTQIIFVYTRKHYRDIYGELQENPFFYHPMCRAKDYGHHGACGYRAIITAPHKVEPVYDENGVVKDFIIGGDYEVLWPEMRPLKWLLEQKYRYGEVYFNREYQNDPTGMEGVVLLDRWLRYWVHLGEWTDAHDEGPYITIPSADEMRFYLSVDPAISTKTGSDYFALCTLAVDRAQNIYLYETYQEHLEFPDQVKKILSKAADIRPAAIFIESNAYQDALRQQTVSLSGLNIVPVKTSKDKTSRAIAITPQLEQGKVFVREDMDEFLNQYRQFPSGKNDDLIDAFVLGLQEITFRHIGNVDFEAYLPGGRIYEPDDRNDNPRRFWPIR